jgi:hypothetical protein
MVAFRKAIMGSMVAVKGMLSIKAEAMAETHRTRRMARVKFPWETCLTHSAMI